MPPRDLKRALRRLVCRVIGCDPRLDWAIVQDDRGAFSHRELRWMCDRCAAWVLFDGIHKPPRVL